MGMLSSTCEQHGAADILARTGAAWFCLRCMEDQLATEARESWIAERAATLMATASIPATYLGQHFAAETPEQKAVRRQARIFRDLILAEPT